MVGVCFILGGGGLAKSIERAGKSIPGNLYRMWFEQQVGLSLHDRGMGWFACVLFWEEGVRQEHREGWQVDSGQFVSGVVRAASQSVAT